MKIETTETTHTKKGHDLFVAKLDEKCSARTWIRLKAHANLHDGYYSSYRFGGAVPGFQFLNSEDRKNFITVANKELENEKPVAVPVG